MDEKEHKKVYKPTTEATELARKIFEAGKKHDSIKDNLDVISSARLIDQLVEQRQETRPHETIVIGMKGEVVKMGTMFVDDEQLTGVFVMCDPDEFTKQTTNILYRDVKITPLDDSQ